ncbi:gluconate 2-dehydrogenase subunit 3 family protein [Myxococcus sp. CA051A]|uniref:Gluconate 2-dehydrogenase subunit 3 family protein n=1 Tax=Myxococcus llanfairpwllgwyngyllgogerychwyrndrobwllllantysiliogogogochensis TaxID=2590453 RepID=A0A540WSH4_9BACT|nr:MULTISPECIES: gluconate 2-dehydrogenase subunit 3 family protein [Myxococcus]NTX00906.1 gluconate 2-dehydrogenase subunit 3 family protein [Myxococcus sp. CA040A]NTX12389.1 gluconate 2-dehydrogenase subunit 3 family protein [Myxococcus sp. CA056]NTX55260.1 gluconate 2-dehydrogenase subunit 3 family protein [Myxococcus sp. CA039A]NTX59484.1 gluconate 2-dehydrogenase subunit 3 family protein [Myxococcus sp. CA051A]TQF11334.1 gluconate 2-dehydrogenase subunit 3 family protein [Myxococcus llanf
MSPSHVGPPALSRRGLLKRGVFGGALLALGGSGVLILREGLSLPLPEEGLLVLGPREYATFQALARRAFQPREGWPDADTVRVAFLADRLLARGDPSIAREVRDVLGIFDNALAGLLFAGGVTPFSRLAPEAQDAVLEDWRTSRLVFRRGAFHALRSLAHAAYYSHPAAIAATGYVVPQGFHVADAPVWRGPGDGSFAGSGGSTP